MKTYNKHKVTLADGSEVMRYNIPLNKGWTKERVMDVIRKGNNNTVSRASISTIVCDLVGEACSYRGDNNNKCFIGCFIPDSKYTSNMEGKTVVSLYPNIREDLPFEDAYIPDDFGGSQQLISLFQQRHDRHSAMSPVDLYTSAQNFLDTYFVDNP